MRQLSTACLDGRITPRELAARAAAAQAATTIAGLRRITGDLPAPASGAVTGAQRRARRLLLGFLAVSGWRPHRALRPKVTAVAVLGEVVIDLRHTPVTSYRTEITAVAVAGEVLIIVPPGMRATTGPGACIAGYVTVPDAAPPAGPLVPVIAINSYAFLGDIRVRREPAAGGEAQSQDGL
jgi:hypothetical protein